MSQTTDTVLADQSGASFRTELNAIISALNTDFTGATAPVTPEAYMRWLDTSVSPNVLRRRNAANSAWELHPTQQLATDAMPKSGGTFTGAYNGKQGTDIASAATTNIGAATGNSVNITGVVTITSLGTPAQAGIKRTVTFTGILILTHNATTLILPSAANVRTQVGDVAEFISTATGWRCTMYRRASGAGGVVDGTKGADIASAATTDIGAATGDYVVVTGTTTITALGTAPAGEYREVRFDGALTLTHNATTLILPNGVNITTVAGDVARFRSEGAGNWRCTNYTRADGSPLTISTALAALALAALAAGAIGSTVLAARITATVATTIRAEFGNVVAGSDLRPVGFGSQATTIAGAAGNTVTVGIPSVATTTLSGSWMCVGTEGYTTIGRITISMWRRIA